MLQQTQAVRQNQAAPRDGMGLRGEAAPLNQAGPGDGAGLREEAGGGDDEEGPDQRQ